MSKTPPHEPAVAPPAEPKAGNGMLRLIIVAAFIMVIVAAECGVVYFMLPPASVIAKSAEEKLAQEKKSEHAEEEEPSEPEETPTSEVELGTFSISSHQPAANTTLRIDFKLVATVNTADKSDFEGMLAKHQNRLRDRIIFEIRNAEVQDLSDPGLGLIKRRILERVNALLGRPLLQGVVFSDFSFAGA